MEINNGDIVTHALHGNTEFKVVATKTEPYPGLGASPFNAPTPVREGYDFLIVKVEDDTEGISPFVDARTQDLTKVS